MAKINQIQQALMELDGGAFQKLADSYLLRKDYPQINPIGSVAGSNKVRKGTPDSLIQTPDGKYIFGEYTTISANQVYGKFCDDIAKCLDESKTGIAIEKIKEIVLCYTSDLSADDIDKLREQCETVGVNLNLFGLGAISYDLLEKYPSIAKDYLGIEVDTGQILPLEKFISLYEKNKLTTTLKTAFHFREEEKSNLLSSMENNNLVIVSGQAGVGKSRIAIECYQQFIKDHKSYKAFCIFNQGIDLFEDVKSYFSDSGDYLIFVDDANRISGFQYILQLLQTKRCDQNFKIIVTVRDYALDKIRGDCKSIEVGAEISLNPFTDEEIKKLLQDEFEIHNHLYLERIIDIAHGNPRVAIMAAQIAKDSNTLDSIRDISELYDIYYSSITDDLNALKDANILKVAGIVTFFRSVDRTNSNLMQDINEIFDISAEDFWEASKKLHDMEVLDMFENEVVKISDQVLATYLFYLVFFKQKIIDFSILINKLFPQFKQRLIDAINPIVNTFNFEDIKKTMALSVDKAWEQMQEKDENAFLQLMHVFWFLKPTETLIFIQDKINSIDNQETCIDDIKFEADSSSSLPEFLSTLSSFRFLGKDELDMSLELLLKYAEKQPQDTPKILNCFVNSYGFQPGSYNYCYLVQHAVVDNILKCCDSGKNKFFSRMFIALAENFLHTHFSTTKSGRGYTVTWTQFNVVETSELVNLRNKILTNLFSLYKEEYFQQYILSLLLSYAQSGINISVGSIVEHDSKLITSFFKNELDPTNLFHCIIVHQYLGLLKRFKHPSEEKLKALFESASYTLYDLFTNRFERAEMKLSSDAYEEYKKKKIAKFAKSFSRKDYDLTLHELFSIEQHGGRNKWCIDQGIILLLDELANKNLSLFVDVVEDYLSQGEYLQINPWVLVSTLIRKCGAITASKIIFKGEYPSKSRWIISYYQHLSEDDIKEEQIGALSELYKTSELSDFANADFLLKYERIKKGFVAEIVQIIINRADSTPEFAHVLSLIFNKHSEINKQLFSLFLSNLALLEEAYIAVDKVESHSDYDGSTFSELLDNDQSFIDRYLEDKFSRKKYLSSHDDSRDYSFIWLRDGYMDVVSRISETVFKYQQEGRSFDYYKSFFYKNNNPQTDEKILERQDEFLAREISSKSSNREFMCLLFSVIVEFESDRKLLCYKAFLDKNKEFDDFESLPFEPMFSSWSGSAVPMLQEKIDLYEKIIPICNTVQLLKHKQLIEQKIQNIRHKIQHEKKRDFTEYE